ncbi:MAG: LytTR family DNA-binding domain-containing protein [Bacillota bacterium]|nr:LytTR family DNA-binding domain-containing protein [Bacillota bacterium]
MKKVLIVKSGRHRYAIPFSDIVYMEKDKRKVIVHTRTEEKSFYGKYEEILPLLDSRFINPHRSFILNMDYIIGMDKHTVSLHSGESVRFCRECLERTKKSYDNYIANNLAKP